MVRKPRPDEELDQLRSIDARLFNIVAAIGDLGDTVLKASIFLAELRFETEHVAGELIRLAARVGREEDPRLLAAHATELAVRLLEVAGGPRSRRE